MKKTISRNIRAIFLFGDLIILNIAAIISFFASLSEIPKADAPALFLCINLSWIGLAILNNPYHFSRISRFAKILRNHFSLILIHFLAVTTLIFFLKIEGFGAKQLIILYVLLMLLLFAWRIFFFYLNKTFLIKQLNYKNVVIVGFGDLAWEMRKFFRLHPEFGYRFKGYLADGVKDRNVASLDNVESFCLQNRIDEIYCCLPYVDNNHIKRLVDFGLANLIKVKIITDYRGFFQRGIKLENYDSIPVLNIAAIPLDEKKNQQIKRTFDIIFASLVLLFVLSWLIPIIAFLIKLDSRGPVFFKQKRAGKGNRPFNCLKFRTMVVHHHEFKQAEKNDPRVTRIGKFLRKTSLDEIPQFINVLKGDMSIIGPRPHPIKLNEEFSPRIEKFMARHYVKPGITGLAQAKGYRGETRTIISMKNRVKLDRFYIENWSFLLDLKIVLATVIAIVKGDEKAF